MAKQDKTPKPTKNKVAMIWENCVCSSPRSWGGSAEIKSQWVD